MTLNLEINKWYAWQMIPGYNGEKYISPIKIFDIDMHKGDDVIVLNFYNACYAQGVRDFCHTLKIISHSRECLICEIDQGVSYKEKRMAIIEKIDFQWLRRYIINDEIDTDSSVDEYLDENFY